MITFKNTAKELKESAVDIAVIPIGSVEQHATHLPIGTDVFLAEAFGKGIAEELEALLLPVLPISTCYEHKGVKGSICMRPSTFYTMLQDIVLCLKDQGIKKIIVVLGHGGVFVAGPAVRELNALYDDLQVVLVSDGDFGKDCIVLESNKPEIHAGEGETSLMLYLHENLVNRGLMMKNDCVPDFPQSFLNHVPVCRISKTGAWGEPSLATKEKGEKLYKAKIEDMVEYIKKSFEISPEESW